MPTCGVERAADLLHCHEATVYELAKAGTIKGRKVGRAWVFVEADLLEFVREGECQSTKEGASGGSMSPTLKAEESGPLLASVIARVACESTTSSRRNSGNDAQVVQLSTVRSMRGPRAKRGQTETE